MADRYWTVEITRTLRVDVPAASHSEAREAASLIAWDWLPEQASGLDQGKVIIRVVREPDLPGDGGGTDATH